MNTVQKRILTFFLSLLLISYVLYQAYAILYNPITTMRVESGTFNDTINTEVYVIKDETVLNQKTDGIIDYVKQDGESVANGGEVAVLYNTEQDAENQRKIQQLDLQIQQYQQMGSADEASSLDINVLESEINKVFLQLSEDSDSTNVNNIETDRSALLTLLDEKQLATGEIKDFSAQISKLQQQVDELNKNSSAQTGTINSPVTGYFVSKTDGLENLYSTDNAVNITAEEVDKLLAAKPVSNAGSVGKVITDFEYYIVCTVSDNDSYKLHVGDAVQLNFLLSSAGNIPVTVAAINKDSSGCAVVFKCDIMSGTLAVIRRQDVQIIANNYTGLQVPDSCIHIVNGTKGVFVRIGSLVQFKKIDQIYSDAGYVISAFDPSEQDFLQNYDEVIENGDDLYDGEIIK